MISQAQGYGMGGRVACLRAKDGSRLCESGRHNRDRSRKDRAEKEFVAIHRLHGLEVKLHRDSSISHDTRSHSRKGAAGHGTTIASGLQVRDWHLADMPTMLGYVRFRGVKRTFGSAAAMSANDPQRT